MNLQFVIDLSHIDAHPTVLDNRNFYAVHIQMPGNSLQKSVGMPAHEQVDVPGLRAQDRVRDVTGGMLLVADMP